MRRTQIDWSLYAILDKDYVRERPIEQLAEQAIRGGVTVIQLRNKSYHSAELYVDALKTKSVTERYDVPLIINDRLDVALAVDADGVHLGQNDLPHSVARKLLGKDKTLGLSVHNLDEFERSVAANPDYLGVGTVYPSKTKRELQTKGLRVVENIRARTRLPFVAIGGITPQNLEPVIQAGADGVAVVSALWSASDVRARAEEFAKNIRMARSN